MLGEGPPAIFPDLIALAWLFGKSFSCKSRETGFISDTFREVLHSGHDHCGSTGVGLLACVQDDSFLKGSGIENDQYRKIDFWAETLYLIPAPGASAGIDSDRDL